MDQAEEKQQSDKGEGHDVEVVIHVNDKLVRLQSRSTTGLAVKQAAMAQGVQGIQLNFVLLKELGGGRTEVIGDGDTVHVNDESRFACIHPDDNS